MSFILASTSIARRAMLTAAGVAHEAIAPNVDEAAIKAARRSEGAAPEAVAEALADAKAVDVSQRRPRTLVLGADQVLALPDGRMLDKPADLAEARAQLRLLRGGVHRLISVAAIAENGVVTWRCTDSATLSMRDFSDSFLEDYIAQEGDALLTTVGGYRLEGLGAQLFASVTGDHFTILGLPLLAVLGHLRTRGILPS